MSGHVVHGMHGVGMGASACNGQEVLWNPLAGGREMEDSLVEEFCMVIWGIWYAKVRMGF